MKGCGGGRGGKKTHKKIEKKSRRQPHDDSSLCRNSWAVTGEDMELGTSLKQVVHSRKKTHLSQSGKFPMTDFLFFGALSGSQKSNVCPSGVTRRMKVCDRLSESFLLVWMKRRGKHILKVLFQVVFFVCFNLKRSLEQLLASPKKTRL